MKSAGEARPFKRLAQLGYSARGVIYLVIGGLAVMAATGNGEGETTDSKGAITKILEQPFGNVMLAILVLGLAGYVLWRLVQAVKDTDHHGHSGKGLAVRGGLLVSAITHTALAVFAVRLMLGDSSGGGSGGGSWLSTTPGLIVMGIVGVALIGAGFAHFFKGWTARFEKYMTIPGDKRRWAKPLCQFGLIARGVVWCIVGVFFIRSALRTGSGDIEGTEEALNALATSTYGPWLLGIVAVGLMAFGVYSFLEAMYRRINAPEPT